MSTKVFLLVVAGVVSVSLVVLLGSNYLDLSRTNNDEVANAESESAATLNATATESANINTESVTPTVDQPAQGTVISLVAGNDTLDTADVATLDGGYVTLTLESTDTAASRATVHYWKYDKTGELESERTVSYGPADSGWEIEVLKVSDGRAVLTVPIRPGQSF